MRRSESPEIIVDFIGCSADPVAIRFLATRVNRDKAGARETFKILENGDISQEGMERYLKREKVEKTANAACTVQFLFNVYNISRHCMDQMATHYPGVLFDPSDGLETASEGSKVPFESSIPPELAEKESIMKEWRAIEGKLTQFYERCLQAGIDRHSADLLLPMGIKHHKLLTFSFQTLQRYLDQMMCTSANWEQQELSWQIFRLMKEKFPRLAERMGIKCWENRNLYCDENKGFYQSCRWAKERPHQQDFLNLWAKKTLLKASSPPFG